MAEALALGRDDVVLLGTIVFRRDSDLPITALAQARAQHWPGGDLEAVTRLGPCHQLRARACLFLMQLIRDRLNEQRNSRPTPPETTALIAKVGGGGDTAPTVAGAKRRPANKCRGPKTVGRPGPVGPQAFPLTSTFYQLRSLFTATCEDRAPHSEQFSYDYPRFAAPVEECDSEWLPLSEVQTPFNSPSVLAAALASVPLANTEHAQIACLPLRDIVGRISQLAVECPGRMFSLKKRALAFYGQCGLTLANVAEVDIGVIATATYFAIDHLEHCWHLLGQGHVHTFVQGPQVPDSLFALAFPDGPDDAYTHELVRYAAWLHLVNYIDIVEAFVRSGHLTDNVISNWEVDEAGRGLHTVSDRTWAIDTSIVLNLDPAYAPYIDKSDPIKQLGKLRPKRNAIRSADSSISHTLQAAPKGTGGRRAAYHTWVRNMLVCSFTGAYLHANERLDFLHALYVYRALDNCDDDLAAFVSKLPQAIRFVMRELHVATIRSTPECIEQNGIRYGAYRIGVLGACDYMREIIGRLPIPFTVDDLIKPVNAGINSIVTSKQVDSGLRELCGTRYRELRRLQHPLVSEPKGEFYEFLGRAVYSVLQAKVATYMSTHEEAELCYRLLQADDATNRNVTEARVALDALCKGHHKRYPYAGLLPLPLSLDQRTVMKKRLTELLQQLDPRKEGALLYMLSGDEQFDIFRVMLSIATRSHEEVVAELINRYLPYGSSGATAVTMVYRKYIIGSSEKSAAAIVQRAMQVRDLARLHFLLRVRRLVSSRLLPVPATTIAKTEVPMILQRLGSLLPRVPAHYYNIYYAPCCHRITTFAEKDKMGNSEVVYNTFHGRYECGRADGDTRLTLKAGVTATLYKPVFTTLTPFLGDMATTNKNLLNKNARAFIQNYYRLECQDTPVVAIPLREMRLIFRNNDGGSVAYYHCPMCARLVKTDMMANRVTWSACAICRRESLHFKSWAECGRCGEQYEVGDLTTVVVVAVKATLQRMCTTCIQETAVPELADRACAKAATVCREIPFSGTCTSKSSTSNCKYIRRKKH